LHFEQVDKRFVNLSTQPVIALNAYGARGERHIGVHAQPLGEHVFNAAWPADSLAEEAGLLRCYGAWTGYESDYLSHPVATTITLRDPQDGHFTARRRKSEVA
jgi:hypothetical protein